MINLSSISPVDKILYVLIIFTFFIMITISVVLYLKAWSQNLRYVKMEIRRAENDSERRHWERELKMVYWSLIPGITVRRLKKIRQFFKKNKSKQ